MIVIYNKSTGDVLTDPKGHVIDYSKREPVYREVVIDSEHIRQDIVGYTIEYNPNLYDTKEISDAEVAVIEASVKRNRVTKPSYGDLVDSLIRLRYSQSEELSILRQRDEKPAEFAEYYNYCEECKLKAKERLGITK